MQVLRAFPPFQDLHFVFGTGRNASLVQREVARRYGAPAKAQRKRVWWGEEV